MLSKTKLQFAVKNLIQTLLFFLLITQISFAQWVQTNEPNSYVYSFAISGVNLFAGGYGGVYLTTNNGTSWTAVNSGLSYTIVIALAVSPNGTSGANIFAGTGDWMYSGGEGVYLSTDNGTSWTAVDSGLTDNDVLALAVSPNGTGGTNLFAGTGGRDAKGIFLSTNNGTTWTAVDSGLTNTYVRSLAVSPNGTGGTNIFAGTAGGVFLSTNNGTSWTAVDSGLTNTYVVSLVVSPEGTSGTHLFAGTDPASVFVSTNNGTSWTAVDSGLTDEWVDALAVSPNGTGGTNLFAGTAGGVFLSTNNGTSWTADNTGLNNTDVRALTVSGTNLFAATFGGGVWRRPLSEMITSVDRPLSEVPKRFSLDQNYPNPFNPSTTIKYSIPKQSYVTLKVYDILGREVAALVNEEKPAGNYEVEFSPVSGIRNLVYHPKGMASGIYFYQLKAGDYVNTKKMILLK